MPIVCFRLAIAPHLQPPGVAIAYIVATMALTTGAMALKPRVGAFLNMSSVVWCADVAPRIHLTPAQVLQDEDRMKRLKVALCDGIFAYADDEIAARIVDECLKVCGGARETLSEALQTKFFVQHTPFYWIITNRPHTKPGAPPLLVRLISVCDELNQETQEEIVRVLYAKYESGMYLAVQPKLTGVPTHEAYNPSPFFRDVGDQPVVTATFPDSAAFSFHIPRFFDRLAVDEEVWFEFPHLGKSVVLSPRNVGMLTANLCAHCIDSGSLFRVRAYLGAEDSSTEPNCKLDVNATLEKYPGATRDSPRSVELQLESSGPEGQSILDHVEVHIPDQVSLQEIFTCRLSCIHVSGPPG